ncbi:MAG: BREX-1 system adenine-specific DNA-methyltransferase PglX [Planctomycetes bacterium]|nr:BREX-1 system adenine-specific DNA-methyltransferase PglX [Planctomycetota bacterium]
MNLHEMTLEARAELTQEIRELLEGTYGQRPDGRFDPPGSFPALKALPEARETRKRLEKFLADEAAAGLGGPEAVEKLIKEAAFTHLNRLVAFKMLEARKLIRGTIDKHHESNAFKFYIAEDAHGEDRKLHEAGSLPQNPLGEGPRDIAYRRFLLWQCGKLAKEIKVLFDPDNLPSRLFPRPAALKRVIDILNHPDLAGAWQPGSEETIGWVYQFWSEEEKARAFRKVFKEKQKFSVQDLPAVTQIFTPRWIVRWLVENTLGRLWVHMHPETRIQEKLKCLIPLAGELPEVTLRKACEINLLDPACGTMHFGLVAFDLLVEMYREELDNQGIPGWPDKASVASEAEIAPSIIKNNLFGIDIDLRAVQLSALTLYVKAKTFNPKAEIKDSNLACADILLINGERIDEFLSEMKFAVKVHEKVIKSLWSRLKNAGHFGTLLRLEEEILSSVEVEKKAYKDDLEIFKGIKNLGDAYLSGGSFWRSLDEQITSAFQEFARKQEAQGRDAGFFTGEAVKGMKIADIMMGRYDVVVANPPYMSRRNMNPELAEFLERAYPDSKGDLYSAFIDRSSEFLKDGGRLGMITQQSFMFITSYEKLRDKLLDQHAIECMCHVGPRAFEEIVGEKVNTTLFVLRREGEAGRRDGTVGTYFRLVKEPDAEAKRLGFERALARLRGGEVAPPVYRYRQADFDAIPGRPWVYWIMPSLRKLFETLPKLDDISEPRVGLQTGENFRFLRYWWEVGIQNMAFSFAKTAEAEKSGKRWFPYMKGGSFRRWYGNQEYALNWEKNGCEIDNFDCSVIRNPSYYFRRGVTWTDLTSGRFSARLSPGGFIFDVAGSSVFPENVPLVLGVMNSSLSQCILKLINPTVHVQVGDLSRLPIPKKSSRILDTLVEEAIALAKAASEEDERTFDFIAPPDWRNGLDDVVARAKKLADIERAIDEEVYRIYDISPEDRAAIEAELREPASASEDGEEASGEESEENGGDKTLTRKDLATRWIGYAAGIVLGRFLPGAASPSAGERALGRGRFEKKTAAALRDLTDSDGAAVLDPGHADDLAKRVKSALEVIYREDGTEEILAAALGERGGSEERLRNYLEGDFFREHLKIYRKRPVYWLLQSPKKCYGFYLFHERITIDTLPRLLGQEYLQARIQKAQNAIADGRASAAGLKGRAKTEIEKEIERNEDLLLDLEVFEKNLRRVLEARNDRGEPAGWTRELDDGVLINLAPLASLIPAWSREPARCWKDLESGKYDWSHTAMRYWPERVLKKCKANKSYAIAHGRLDAYKV